jgi:hypothetical protein
LKILPMSLLSWMTKLFITLSTLITTHEYPNP